MVIKIINEHFGNLLIGKKKKEKRYRTIRNINDLEI